MRSVVSTSAVLAIVVSLGLGIGIARSEEGVKASAGHQYLVGVSGMR